MPLSQLVLHLKLKKGINSSFVFLQLELLITFLGMERNRLEASVQIWDQLDYSSFPGLPALSCFLLCFSGEEWWQSSFPFNSSQACWKEPLVYVLFFRPVRSWDEIFSINHKAYYYFKYLHLPGEGTHWLPAGEINGVSFLAGTLSLGKNKKRHRSSCSVYCRKRV